ncbi:hypothetical protein CROQUDRAFT_95565 [Cronartium quercuum f. sp. fusiforme G11]|uniref:Uncharacterized protein n=1 Tax=Cronartium quercuum f. sp. fusiforme G11 TaxID=708437 RepID=A0A9P6T9C4_9BASI|nr:hypothetical protein CROQUDRAFT_95565 [Cronartium quercuum f. sp. fusiforme G11]
MSRPMQADVAARASRQRCTIHQGPLFRNEPLPISARNSVSFGSHDVFTKGLFVAQPRVKNSGGLKGLKALGKAEEDWDFASDSEYRVANDAGEAQAAIKEIAIGLMQPPSWSTPVPAVRFAPRQAIHLITEYIRRFDDRNDLIAYEGLKALRQIVSSRPIFRFDVHGALNLLLSSKSLGDRTRRIYFDLVRKEAREHFEKFDIEKFKIEYQIFLGPDMLEFAKSFESEGTSETALADEMEQVLRYRSVQDPRLGDNRHLWISVFFHSIGRAKTDRIDMFDMLHEFSNFKHNFVGENKVMLIEDAIFAQEGCRRLATNFDFFKRRYEVLVARNARKSLSDMMYSTFSLQTSTNRNTRIQEAAKVLLDGQNHSKASVAQSLDILERTVNTEAGELTTSKEDNKLATEILFRYGISLIKKGNDVLENTSFLAVVKILEDFSSLKLPLETRTFAAQALKTLTRASSEAEVERNSKLEPYNELDEWLKVYFTQFRWHIEYMLVELAEGSQAQKNSVTSYYREKLGKQESDDILPLVEQLIKPESVSQNSKDGKYEIFDKIQRKIITEQLQVIHDHDIYSSSNWRHMLLLILASGQALDHPPDTRFIRHLVNDLEDMTYTTTGITRKLAQISLEALREHTKIPSARFG